MIEIERIVDGMTRFGDRFLNRFFTEGELLDCGNQPHRLAARIAAKEAVAKVLGTGIGHVRWVDIEVRVDNPHKRPTLHLYGTAAQVAAELNLTEWDVSLSHSKELASAVAVAD